MTAMFYQSLNQDSLRRIKNIVRGFKNHQTYATYKVRSYCYDSQAGVHAIEVGKNGQLINLWLFYPGINGEISSIAIYGSHLQGHLNAIRSSMSVFGMPVESADMDFSGMSDFVDIYLEEYE